MNSCSFDFGKNLLKAQHMKEFPCLCAEYHALLSILSSEFDPPMKRVFSVTLEEHHNHIANELLKHKKKKKQNCLSRYKSVIHLILAIPIERSTC
jgi:hypothetical protein